eukprot:CAMPEP_0170073106 /NCGR_PEP_ID=MMETSP0019_2-20121128/10581_1 /TAXON_ID=98059 /ORGANISM="Dinobryon sp., Strain UTEXLB2267" /LENGTH=200 /DNA_ID=CAMNT_0010282419 /DNA_START=10 /DNA_END=612 /DNA_ORIENTATION=-
MTKFVFYFFFVISSIHSFFLSKTALSFGTSISNLSGSSSLAATKYPIYCDEDVMNQKSHGTCVGGVMKNLRWNCELNTADRICCYNRHYAEYAGYWEKTSFLKEADKDKEITFYDSVTGKPLFIAPRGRSFEDFRKESASHGWPSFRDNEVVWENVRCLKNGEAVSVDGTHLGHNLPDRNGNRYCINLVSVAGYPAEGSK